MFPLFNPFSEIYILILCNCSKLAFKLTIYVLMVFKLKRRHKAVAHVSMETKNEKIVHVKLEVEDNAHVRTETETYLTMTHVKMETQENSTRENGDGNSRQ